MAISSTNNIKLSLIFIKENFGSIWMMTLKVFLSLIPLLFTLGLTFAIVGGAELLSTLTSMGISPNIGEATQMMEAPSVAPMAGEIAGISTSTIIIAALINLVALILPLLAVTAMVVAMMRSVVFEEKLDTSIFSKLCDKNVIRVFITEIIIGLVFLGVTVIIIGATLMITSQPGSAGILQGLFFCAPILIPVIIFFALRIALIPVGIAVGDIQCASEAFPKTKGQLFNVFKIGLLAFLVSIVVQIITQIPVELTNNENTMVSMIGLILLFAAMVVAVPLYHIGSIALSHLYKKIR